jgi:tripartite-type tricarboxylate transporter receptor subunit TctC
MQLLDFVRANPGRLKYTSGGAYGSPSHVAGELFNMMAAVNIPYVPSSKGHGAAGTALSSGKVDLLYDAVVSSLPHIKSGEWRALAVTTPKRAAALPDVPTVAECGLPGYDVGPSTGVVAPAGTPNHIVSLLSRTIAKIMQVPDVQTRFRSDGKETLGTTPEAFRAYIETEIAKWRDVVKHAGIKVKEYAPPDARNV